MNMLLEYMCRNYCVLYPWKCIGRFNIFCVSKSYNKNKFKNNPHHMSIVRCCHDNILFMLFIFHCVPPSCRWSTSLRALNIQFSWKMHNYYCIWYYFESILNAWYSWFSSIHIFVCLLLYKKAAIFKFFLPATSTFFLQTEVLNVSERLNECQVTATHYFRHPYHFTPPS